MKPIKHFRCGAADRFQFGFFHMIKSVVLPIYQRFRKKTLEVPTIIQVNCMQFGMKIC